MEVTRRRFLLGAGGVAVAVSAAGAIIPGSVQPILEVLKQAPRRVRVKALFEGSASLDKTVQLLQAAQEPVEGVTVTVPYAEDPQGGPDPVLEWHNQQAEHWVEFECEIDPNHLQLSEVICVQYMDGPLQNYRVIEMVWTEEDGRPAGKADLLDPRYQI